MAAVKRSLTTHHRSRENSPCPHMYTARICIPRKQQPRNQPLWFVLYRKAAWEHYQAPLVVPCSAAHAPHANSSNIKNEPKVDRRYYSHQSKHLPNISFL